MKRLIRTVAVAWILGLALCGFGYWWSLDAPPPDTSDLRVERPEIPEEENGWTYFVRAAEAVDMPEDTYSSERVRQLLDGEIWDEALARELFERNEEAFELWQKGLDCTTAVMSREEALDLDCRPPFSRMRNLAMLASLRAEYDHRQGRDEEAFADGLRVVRYGHWIQGAKGPLVNYLVGTALGATGCGQLREMLPDAELAADRMKSYVEQLGRYTPTGEALADSHRVEYAWMARFFAEDGLFAEADVKWSKGVASFLYHRNRTIRMLARLARGHIRNAPWVYADRVLPEMPEIPDFEDPLMNLKLVLKRNPIARLLVVMTWSALEAYHDDKCELELQVSATRVLMALKAYKAENDALPESLGDLVPEYIAEVPQDPYDGQPLRYSREKEIIYSVGEDLEDGGGAPEGTEEGQGADPTFRIAF
mgnify:FL=1